jgi:hypothetical protein
MQTMTHAEPLEVLMRFGTDPQLAQRASTWAQPIVAASGMPRFVSVEGEEPAPEPVQFSIPDFIAQLTNATGRQVRDIILMPDDGQNAIIQAKIMNGELSPKKRVGLVLGELYDRQAQTLSRGLRQQLRDSLNRVFHRRETNNGFEFAMAAARTDILYHFFCAAIMGDESRTKRLSGLVRCLHAAIPLAVVDVQKGIWLVHRA